MAGKYEEFYAPVFCGLVSLLTAWIMAIAIFSMMVSQTRNEEWRLSLVKFYGSGASTMTKTLTRDWELPPFVDIVVRHAEDFCPVTHPEDVMYEIWPGTRMRCDCLEREGDRLVDMDMVCERGDKEQHNSPDCIDAMADAPQVLNRFGGVRYCGKRALLSLRTVQRPVKGGDGQYSCPTGTIACNPEWLESESTLDYVVCRSELYKDEQACPITSLAFLVADEDATQWEFVPLQSDIVDVFDDDKKGIYVSRSAVQHGIQRVAVTPNPPCLDKMTYNASFNQKFFYAEIGRGDGVTSCELEAKHYRELEQDPERLLNEWDMQLENGLLNRMDEILHYTYSVWPSSEFKKKVQMKYYQQPIFNYKLECEQNPETNMDAFYEQFTEKEITNIEYGRLLELIENSAVVCLILTIVMPIVTHYLTVIFTPVTLIAMAFVILKLAMLVSRTADTLEKDILMMEIPTWVNSCLDERDGQIDLQALEQVKTDSIAFYDELRRFEYLAKAQFSIVMILVGFPFIALILMRLAKVIGCKAEYFKEMPDQGDKFFKAYLNYN